jgi:hypothetical protein
MTPEDTMHRTIEVIIHPDGRIEPMETITGAITRRALLTILNEPPVMPSPLVHDNIALDTLLSAAGLLELPSEISADLEPLSEETLDALWARIPVGTSLAQIIIEDREETF